MSPRRVLRADPRKRNRFYRHKYHLKNKFAGKELSRMELLRLLKRPRNSLFWVDSCTFQSTPRTTFWPSHRITLDPKVFYFEVRNFHAIFRPTANKNRNRVDGTKACTSPSRKSGISITIVDAINVARHFYPNNNYYYTAICIQRSTCWRFSRSDAISIMTITRKGVGRTRVIWIPSIARV